MIGQTIGNYRILKLIGGSDHTAAPLMRARHKRLRGALSRPSLLVRADKRMSVTFRPPVLVLASCPETGSDET
jgi:hypothetical protein